jgi:hypothetical protein
VATRRLVHSAEPIGGGPPPTSWQRVAGHPERWERPGFGAIESRSPELWAILPTCGHSYGALSLIDAQRHLDEHEGRCFVCWYRSYAFRSALNGGPPPIDSSSE